jgi:hypothetical protein
MTQVGVDPEWEEVITACLADWQVRGLIQGFTVGHDAGEGAYHVTFVLGEGPPLSYSLTEAEFCMYVQGVVDLAPATAGPKAIALADASREVEK